MQQEDDLRGLAKVMEFMRAISIVFVVIHVYWFCYRAFVDAGINIGVVDKILLNFQRTAGLFSNLLVTKVFAVIFLALSCLGTKGVKNQKMTWRKIYTAFLSGLVLFFMNWWMFDLPFSPTVDAAIYTVTLTAGYILLLMSDGWINVVNVFRASIVLGTPGSGKSYAVVNNYIKQMISKGFALYLYDYKFDDLSVIAYNELLKNIDKYRVRPEFYVINFDDPRRSHRCNPINPKFMADISDAYESAYTILLNLNKTWIQKQGDFFVESPIILLAAIIWYLRIYKDGKYCTFPHAIEFLNKPYADIFTILTSYPSLENYLSPFMDAWQGGAQDQLQGQIASAKIPLSRMISPQLYWVMTGDDFTLDLNNPEHPKILCVGNNPDRQNIYSAALGLYNSRIVKLVNKKGQLKSSIIIDELPTIYFRGIDNLIATARSNKVAVCLGFQDFSQLTRDYGEKEAKVIQNTVGNIFSGQVVGETAKSLSERFGKILQQRQSISINRQDTSTSINTQLDSLIPASKIANLSQGTFVGSVADNFGEEIDQKIFHARIIVDNEKVAAETKAYKKIPVINEFKDADGNDIMQQQIERNYSRIKADVLQIIEDEMQRIKTDPDLQHLIPKEDSDRKEE